MKYVMEIEPSELSTLRGILNARISHCMEMAIKTRDNQDIFEYWKHQEEKVKETLQLIDNGHFE